MDAITIYGGDQRYVGPNFTMVKAQDGSFLLWHNDAPGTKFMINKQQVGEFQTFAQLLGLKI
jgi:hypothetical protein